MTRSHDLFSFDHLAESEDVVCYEEWEADVIECELGEKHIINAADGEEGEQIDSCVEWLQVFCNFRDACHGHYDNDPHESKEDGYDAALGKRIYRWMIVIVLPALEVEHLYGGVECGCRCHHEA